MAYIEIADADSDGDLDIILSQRSALGDNAYYNENGVFVPQNAEHLELVFQSDHCDLHWS